MPMTTDAYALLDALFANAPVGLVFWDADLRYRRVNATLAAINGVAPADHLGRRPSDVLGELGVEAEALVAKVLADGRPRLEIPFAGQTPAMPGDVRHWVASFYPVLDAGGAPLGVGGVIVEVTGEREARRLEQAASALLDAVFGAAPVGIAFWDTALRFRRVNGALAELTGVPAADHLGRRPEDVLGPVGDEVADMLERCAATREAIVDAEVEVARRAGGRLVLQGTVFPVLDGHAELAGLAGVVRDVTAQHEAAAERTRLLREALTARAAAEAAQVRAESAKVEAEEARRRTDFLATAGERLAVVSRDLEETLQEAARVAVPTISDWCTFTLLDRRGVARTVAAAGRTADEERLALELSRAYPPDLTIDGGVGEVLRTGRPSLVPRIDPARLERVARDAEHLRLLRALGMRSAIIVPLRVRDRTIGALTFVSSTSDRVYGADDLRLAQELAVRAALAVENARLYTERSHIAQTLQRSLLPPALPSVPGLELAARYRAAGEENEVGGDFYDAFRQGDGAWTVIIGDVSGKGAEAAALTSLTRHTLRAASLRALDPLENLALLNEALWSQGDSAGRFCTVLYAQVRPDAQGAAVNIATGGHLPPLVLRAGGRIERLQVRGAIVGGLRDPTFGERTVHLEHDDLLLMFTDGLVELRGGPGRGIRSGEPDMEEVLAQMRGARADEIVAALEARAVELQDGEPRDDIAIVAIRPCPPT